MGLFSKIFGGTPEGDEAAGTEGDVLDSGVAAAPMPVDQLPPPAAATARAPFVARPSVPASVQVAVHAPPPQRAAELRAPPMKPPPKHHSPPRVSAGVPPPPAASRPPVPVAAPRALSVESQAKPEPRPEPVSPKGETRRSASRRNSRPPAAARPTSSERASARGGGHRPVRSTRVSDPTGDSSRSPATRRGIAPPELVLDEEEDELDSAFDRIATRSEAGPSEAGKLAEDQKTKEENAGLFRQMAVAHARPARDFAIELGVGPTTKQWLSIARPAVQNVQRAAEQLGQVDVASALADLDDAMDRAAKSMGTTIGAADRKVILERYRKLEMVLPEVFELKGERDRREPIVVHHLLQRFLAFTRSPWTACTARVSRPSSHCTPLPSTIWSAWRASSATSRMPFIDASSLSIESGPSIR
jgi:hypothetical protein